MIGLCIKYFHENYGGMLQAYATTQVLEEKNIPYELIRYEKKKSLLIVIKSLPRLLNRVLLNDKYEAFQKKLCLKKHPDFAKNDVLRMMAFIRFRDLHFTRLSSVYKGYSELCSSATFYDAVITGSDQLWSPAGLTTNFYNLQFVPDHIRKISYASSFGVKNIPWYQKKRTADFLKRIEFISMRENRGSEIVKELTGRDVPVVLDPVFMFDAKQWSRMIPVKIKYQKPYIFAYFLGKNQEHRRAVNELSLGTGYEIVTLRHLDQYIQEDETFGDYAPYDVEPSDFLNFIRGAEYVCTDSFHGSVFSIILKKQFIIFNRYIEQSKHSKNSRIDTLCKNLGLQDRRYKGQTVAQMKRPIDYQKVEDKLLRLKKETEKYFNNAFANLYTRG